MATTSSTLAGKALVGGPGGTGTGNTGRVAAAVATGVLGLSLLVGGSIGQGHRAATSAVTQASAPALVGARPVEASTDAGYRWDFGQDQRGPRPADASVATAYRWGFGARRTLPGSSQAGYRVSAPNERDPDGTAGVDTAQRPADASTTAEYRWDFEYYPSR